MTINARMLITVLLIAGHAPLWAQNQRLAWVGDEYAMRYEVIIEKEEAGTYNRLLREFTEESFIEVSLSPGKYRCQVIPYDFLNQPIPVTDWVEFEVRSSFHEIITVSEIPSTAPEAVSTEPEKIIEYQNRFDLYLSAVWIWIVPFYTGGREEENFDTTQFFGENADISPYGAGMRLGIVSAKQRLFNPGIELSAVWRTRTLLFDGDLIQQFPFTGDEAAVKLRLGAGISLLADERLWWAAGQYATHFNAGASFIFLMSKNAFMETGIEYSQFFTRDFFCFVRSWMGLGYKW